MVFNSFAFALFLPWVLLLYHCSRRQRQNTILLVAGYVFYGAWDVRFLFLVSVSTALDYCTGLMIGKGTISLRQGLAAAGYVLGFALLFLVPDWQALAQAPAPCLSHWRLLLQPRDFGVSILTLALAVILAVYILLPMVSARLDRAGQRRFFLRCSLIGQLGMLGVFKYYNFFADSAQRSLAGLGIASADLHLDIVLPIGISFYTFQTLSYVLDVYWRRLAPVERLRDFALFVGYFPPLVAGPIERAAHLLPKLMGQRQVTFDGLAQGAYLILLGLFKKVAIADGLAGSVASVYDSTGQPGWLDIAASTLAFAFQIYGDFSGYSDIACGVSLWFGIALSKNFDLPYFALNPAQFWRRWHISLSSWLRDYLYFPLGGNRHGELRTRRNLLLTMLLGGLWHGAAWNFILWGLYQGVLLVAHRACSGLRPDTAPGPGSGSGSGSGPGSGPGPASLTLAQRLPRAAFFFLFVCYGWLLFRANSLAQITHFSTTLLTDFSNLQLTMKRPQLGALLGVPLLLLIEACQLRYGGIHFYARLPVLAHGALYAALTFIFMLGVSYGGSQQFIYFQF